MGIVRLPFRGSSRPRAFRSSGLAVVGTVAFAALFGLPACVRAESASDRHMAEMTDAINRLEGDRDRTDQRLGTIGSAIAEEKGEREKETPTPAGGAPSRAPAPLRSISLGEGDGSGESDDPNDPTARPEIRLVGPPGAAMRSSRRARGRSEDGEPLMRVDAARPAGDEPSELAPRDAAKKSPSGGRDAGSPRSNSGTRSDDGSAKGPKESR